MQSLGTNYCCLLLSVSSYIVTRKEIWYKSSDVIRHCLLCILYRRTQPTLIHTFDTISYIYFWLTVVKPVSKCAEQFWSAPRPVNESRQKSFPALISGVGQKLLPACLNLPFEKHAENATTNVSNFPGTFI